MTDHQREKDFYRQQCDELGGRVIYLQNNLTKTAADLRRSRMTSTLILRIYKLINHDATIEDLSNLFLQAILSTMWADRAVLLRYDKKDGLFIRQQDLGFKDKKPLLFDVKNSLPEYLFINSLTKTGPLTDSLCQFMGTPYLLLSYNRHEEIALLIGNQSEDKKFRLPFEENDREIIESSLNVFIDIVKRKEVEQELRNSEKKHRQLVQSSPESIFIYCDDKITFANDAGIKLLGAEKPGNIIGRSLLEFFHPNDHEQVIQILQTTLEENQESPLLERQMKKLDGSTVDIQVIFTPFTFKKQKAIQILALDISTNKRMEKELLRARQLESLGVLAGGIAHDFNNLLMGVLGNIDLAISDLDLGEKPYKLLKNALGASDRARDLTQKLLTFSQGGAPVKKATSLAELVTNSIDFILSGSNVKCNYLLPADLWAVNIDVVQFSQVIENLTFNALQAMPKGGLLTIQLENVDNKSLKALPLTGKHVRLMIRDQGSGIPQEILPKIFDPYFSTKEQGSGLGLATTYSIVKKHNGLITVESELEKGTTFHVYIPATDKKPAPVKQQVTTVQQADEEKILIMDDEQLVRDVATAMLCSLKYNVESVSEGTEAIECYLKAKETGQPFHAVIMDLTIPGGMGGMETIQKLLAIDPEAKVIVASGYSNDPIVTKYKNYGFQGVLIKPFNTETLGKALSKLLDT